jgi:hypothetical protein
VPLVVVPLVVVPLVVVPLVVVPLVVVPLVVVPLLVVIGAPRSPSGDRSLVVVMSTTKPEQPARNSQTQARMPAFYDDRRSHFTPMDTRIATLDVGPSVAR